MTVCCWAHSLGDCCGNQSREHPVSAAIFENSVVVRGLSWCQEPKRIGINSFTHKNLCVHHNNTLASVDAAGARLYRNIQKAHETDRIRATLRARRWSIQRYTYDGHLLERWFTKTTINLCHLTSDPVVWQGNRGSASEPPHTLVGQVFGQKFKEPMGLYVLARPGQAVHLADEVVEFAPVFDSGAVVGAIFDFHGLRLLLWLSTAAPPALSAIGPATPWSASDCLYRARRINMALDGRTSQAFVFRW